MADDRRYDWLDDDAVERLLRGEALAGTPAGDTADDRARDGAARLDAALGALRVPAPADDAPLPGEEAALAAFRTARAAERNAAAGSAASVVRLGRTAARASAARTFLRRPARSALALALAGCALGGVAVAAGTGVLPAPFGRGGREPAPATSVVADSDTETAAPATGTPRTGPSHGTAGDGRGRSTAPPAPGSATPGGASATPGGGPGTVSPTAEPPRQDPDQDRGRGKDDGRKGDDGHPAVIAKLCRDYLDATRRNSGKGVDDDTLSALERAAGGAAVRAYCDHVLGNSAPGGGSGDQGEDTEGDGGLRNPLRSVPHPLIGLPDLSRTPAVTSGATSAVTPGVTFSEPLAL